MQTGKGNARFLAMQDANLSSFGDRYLEHRCWPTSLAGTIAPVFALRTGRGRFWRFRRVSGRN